MAESRRATESSPGDGDVAASRADNRPPDGAPPDPARQSRDLWPCRGLGAVPRNGVVFLEEQLTIQVPVGVAAGRISAWLDGAFDGASDGPSDGATDGADGTAPAGLGADAYAAGNAVLRRAGFAGITKEVAIQTLPPYQRGETTVIVTRMVATGAAGYLFPVLDADFELSPIHDGETRVLLRGTYRPPLGSLGAALDRAVLHRAAEATVRRLISQAAEVATEAPPGGFRAEPDRADLDPCANNG